MRLDPGLKLGLGRGLICGLKLYLSLILNKVLYLGRWCLLGLRLKRGLDLGVILTLCLNLCHLLGMAGLDLDLCTQLGLKLSLCGLHSGDWESRHIHLYC